MPRVIITVPDQNAQPYRFQLDRKLVSLGRGSDNDIVIDSGSVSAKHAEMHRVEGGYELRDSGSTNGIKLHGERQNSFSLRSGMSLKIGDVIFDFTLTEEEQETLNREKPAGPSPISKEAPIPASGMSAADLPPAPRTPPPAERRPVERRPAHAPQPAGGGFGTIFLFIILAAAAFLTGLSIRHQKETGESLFQAIANKGAVERVEPAAAE